VSAGSGLPNLLAQLLGVEGVTPQPQPQPQHTSPQRSSSPPPPQGAPRLGRDVPVRQAAAPLRAPVGAPLRAASEGIRRPVEAPAAGPGPAPRPVPAASVSPRIEAARPNVTVRRSVLRATTAPGPMRTAIVLAELLGPPRALRPYGTDGPA
jgi:hypothetical protein